MATGASLVQSNSRSFRDTRMSFAHRHKICDLQQVCVLRMPTKSLKGVFWNVSRKLFFKEAKSGDIDASKKNSDTYSTDMTNAMGAVLTYRHELGMNYNFMLPDLIVGSCLQIPDDVDQLKNLGVRTIFCLQQNPDLEYFGVDICAICDRAKVIEGIEHIRAPIQDFDAYDLRIRLPSVIAKLHNAVKRNSGITYIHCTAGLGRAPAVAITYMYWLLGYRLDEANEKVQAVRPCFPKLDAIKNATCDIFTGGAKETVVLQWQNSYSHSVEISGLDVGWSQRIPLVYDPKKTCWTLKCRLPVGRYEYKYIIDGRWACNPDEPLTQPTKDGHVNNYVEVGSNSADTETNRLRHVLMKGDALSHIEREYISEKLKAMCDD